MELTSIRFTEVSQETEGVDNNINHYSLTEKWKIHCIEINQQMK